MSASSTSSKTFTIPSSQIAPGLLHQSLRPPSLTLSSERSEERRRRSDAPVPPSPWKVQEFQMTKLPTLMEEVTMDENGTKGDKPSLRKKRISKEKDSSPRKKTTAVSELERLKGPSNGAIVQKRKKQGEAPRTVHIH
ncbi:hypothetical protein BT69DRAFT_1278388 [Atractiella rhizophila]|nr:hypothetical protein BT69DRAFT_1278388 [Atractiella rhizophila]